MAPVVSKPAAAKLIERPDFENSQFAKSDVDLAGPVSTERALKARVIGLVSSMTQEVFYDYPFLFLDGIRMRSVLFTIS